jgi:glutathione synthase/RimK-type ligase-like ATP-grasp enzyme
MSLLGSAFRRLPPVARRDQRIRNLRRKAERPQTEPSFFSMLHAEKRMHALGRPATSVIRHGKFYVYDLARSHGIAIPEQFGRWAHPRDIPWDELPDLVVIKSMRGSTGKGVLPLRRADGGWQIVTHDDSVHTGDQLAARLLELVEAKRIMGPFGAEEFLDEDGSGSHAPMDVKVYAFYGEAEIAVLRRWDKHGDPQSSRFRVVDRDGRDVVSRYAGRPVDHSLAVPPRLGELFEVAERLSVAIRAAFSRIDMYSIGDRIVFGEVTPRPGGDQRYPFPRELDTRLGDAWERAQVRVSRDVAAGGSPEIQMGPVSTVPGVTEDDRAQNVDAVNNPSFQARLNAERRLYALEKALSPDKPPSVIAQGKFWAYDLARSHGIDVPEQLGRWRRPDDIPWDDLPDQVVIKSAFAAAARGVFPLRRTADGWEVIGGARTTSSELVENLNRRRREGQIRGPFGAEEFLDGGNGELPIDVRTYAFYGHVPFVLLRRPGAHGDLDTARFRPVDPHGADLIDVEQYPVLADADVDPYELPRELAVLDPTVPVPKNLAEIVDTAQRFSKAIRMAFARVDLYGMDERVVFGEVTPRPGGRQWLGPELDVMLGDAWEHAEARLRRDVADGTSLQPEWGPHRPPENLR